MCVRVFCARLNENSMPRFLKNGLLSLSLYSTCQSFVGLYITENHPLAFEDHTRTYRILGYLVLLLHIKLNFKNLRGKIRLEHSSKA